MTPRAEILRLADRLVSEAEIAKADASKAHSSLFRDKMRKRSSLLREAAIELRARARAQSEGGDGCACAWVLDPDDSSWDTACGNKHQFAHGDAADNLHVFCPYCGYHLVEPNYDAPPEAGAAIPDKPYK